MELLDALRDGEADFEVPPIADLAAVTATAEDLPEDAIAGYRIGEELHRGGQGVVYRAVQLSTKRNVAIKFMINGLLAGASNKRRFEREIELAGSLRHPGIVSVFDSGLANGQNYFVMDLIEGKPLDRFVSDENLPARSTLELLLKICEAVDHAHQRGVIHRDLKPSNILVDADQNPYCLLYTSDAADED